MIIRGNFKRQVADVRPPSPLIYNAHYAHNNAVMGFLPWRLFFLQFNYFCKINHNCLYSSFKPQFKKLKMRNQTNGKKETQNPAANPSTHTQHNKPAPKIPTSTQQPPQHHRHQHILTHSQ